MKEQKHLEISVKSPNGKQSRLLISGKSTNVTYRVEGVELSDKDIQDINAIKDHRPRMNEIIKRGGTLKYHDNDNATFKCNLLFIDSKLPEFIAECLAVASLGLVKSNDVDAIVSEVAKRNPFGFPGKHVKDFYAHKMKSLMIDTALGMTPATEWLGRYDANGGYLVVRHDGEIVCYHFYIRNDVEDYLYQNTRFERASRSRYNFGSLYRGADGNVYIKLNLQIRFKK